MSDDDSDLDIPEADFSLGVQPHRYARLQSGYQLTVHLDRERSQSRSLVLYEPESP